MDRCNIFTVEGGKDKFAEMVRVRALYNEKQKEIENSIQNAKVEIKKADGLISQTVNELATSFLMRRSKKESKYAFIEKLKKEKEAANAQIEELEEKISELRKETFGTTELPKLCFGRYPYKADGSEELVEWDVIRVKGDRALLLSVNIIDRMRYADELENTAWKDCRIRRWTNGYFYENAFSAVERDMILETEIANPGNTTYKTAASTNTRDFIFIPSVNDAYRFYNFDQDRIAVATEYAASKGIYINEETKGSYWWLRSNGGNMYNASTVNFEGYVFEYGFYVNNKEIGVRPALWISLA